MKNLKLFLFATLAMFVAITGVNAAGTYVAEITKGDVTTQYTKLEDALKTVTGTEDDVTVKVLSDITGENFTEAVTFAGKGTVTIDLDGHTVTYSSNDGQGTNVIVVKGGNLVLTGKEGSQLKYTGSNAAIKVLHKNSSLVVDKDVTVNATSATAILFASSALNNGPLSLDGSALTIKGTVKASGPAIEAQNAKSSKNNGKITIEDGAVLESTGAMAFWGNGAYVEFTAGAATIKGITGIGATTGKFTLNGTHVIGTGDPANYDWQTLNGPTYGPGPAIFLDPRSVQGDTATIPQIIANGGTLESDKTYAMMITAENSYGLAEGSVIDGTEFISPKAGLKVHVINSGDKDAVLGTLEGLIANATFVNETGEISADLTFGNYNNHPNSVVKGATLAQRLVNGSDVTEDEEGNIVVIKPAEPEKDPEAGDPSENLTDNTTVDNTTTDETQTPNTVDSIPTYLAAGAVSIIGIALLGFSIKKRMED